MVNERAAELVCRLDELPAGEMQLHTVRQRKVLLLRVDGDVFAFQNACPHKGAPLDEGCLHAGRRELICPWHRFRFHLESGASVTNPEMVATTFPVEIRDGAIYVTV
ncbi:MAG TPA: Rieske 2Fe-2S domain-containing protein [Candidatus Lustribacter sp.]|jgi:nitrite reductase/ring-hydroxylating ferredoxin subunit|nr:Rieske 2Fe-2S domain-containing protein [Candidatus Lustribacter sp.]